MLRTKNSQRNDLWAHCHYYSSNSSFPNMHLNHKGGRFIHRMLSAGSCLPEVVYRKLSIGGCPPEVVHRRLSTGGCTSDVIHWRLSIGGCPPQVVHRRLSTGGWTSDVIHRRITFFQFFFRFPTMIFFLDYAVFHMTCVDYTFTQGFFR